MRWPDMHGCGSEAEHRAYIHDLWELRIASLTPRQRIRRWWWLNWPGVITVLVLTLAAVAVAVLG